MKALNLKSNGNFAILINEEDCQTEVSNAAFTIDRQNNLNALLASIQSEGLQELHIEQTDFNSFVHKIKSGEVFASDNVNSYEVFVELEEYLNDIKNSEPPLSTEVNTKKAPPWFDEEE